MTSAFQVKQTTTCELVQMHDTITQQLNFNQGEATFDVAIDLEMFQLLSSMQMQPASATRDVFFYMFT